MDYSKSSNDELYALIKDIKSAGYNSQNSDKLNEIYQEKNKRITDGELIRSIHQRRVLVKPVDLLEKEAKKRGLIV